MIDFNWDKLKKQPPEWFRDAKFGLFFHWGVYSVPACENEWYSRNMYAKGLPQNQHHVKTYGKLKDFGYKDFLKMFKGQEFDAEAWADLVVRSGAKYAGPVSEHADNFSMWDSKVNPLNCMNYGPKKDVTAECAKAFRARGIKFLSTFHHQWLWGWFMSTDNEADVYDPENAKYYWDALPLETNRYKPYRLPDDKFNKMWLEKVKEVVDKYEPDMLYFDSRSNIIAEKDRFEMVKHYYEKCGDKDISITYKQEDFPQGIGIYDIERGHFSQSKDFVWQTDDRIEDNITWCIVQNPKYRKPQSVIHQLCDIVSKNGNLLLNVGPNEDGTFHPDALKTLYAIGDWLKINGEAIYGTRPFEVPGEGSKKVTDGSYDIDKLNKQLGQGNEAEVAVSEFGYEDFRFTKKGDSIFAIAFGWPEDVNKVQIQTFKKGYPVEIKSVGLLGYDKKLKFEQKDDFLEISLPDKKPCDFAYSFKINLY